MHVKPCYASTQSDTSPPFQLGSNVELRWKRRLGGLEDSTGETACVSFSQLLLSFLHETGIVTETGQRCRPIGLQMLLLRIDRHDFDPPCTISLRTDSFLRVQRDAQNSLFAYVYRSVPQFCAKETGKRVREDSDSDCT
jgi:hypothetical protein